MTTEERIRTYLDSPIATILGVNVSNYLTGEGFFTAPASTKYHGCYEGGLFDHSWAVMNTLAELTKHNNLTWQRSESPYIVGLLHDLCKIDQYELCEGESPYKYREDTFLKGHGDKSVMMIASLMELTEEEVMCIRYHMGAFTDKEEWRYYTRAVNQYPNVLWTHQADMIASHIFNT